MSIPLPIALQEGFTALNGGVDVGRSPELLDPNKVAFAENTTQRGEYIKPRPAFNLLNLAFPSQETLTAFQSGTYQGSEPYYAKDSFGNTIPLIIASIGGHIYQINLDPTSPLSGNYTTGPAGVPIDGTVADVTPLDSSGNINPNADDLPIAYFCQADKYMIIQDGNYPAIILSYGDPDFPRRSKGTNNEVTTTTGGVTTTTLMPEIGVGTIMAYGQGRIFLVQNGDQIVAGDIVGGGTEVYNFSENLYLAEGGYFTLPVVDNQIRAMGFIQVGDTDTGQGQLIIMADTSISTLDVATDRSTWKDTPIQKIALLGVGASGHRTFTNVNSDVWHRSPDGIRSYVAARRTYETWQNTPLSYEVEPILAQDDPTLLQFASAAYFDRRLLVTYGPHYVGKSVAHNGLAVLSFDNVSSLTQRSTPTWEGFWTGLFPLQIFTVAATANRPDRCFIFSNQCGQGLNLFELTKNGLLDNGWQEIPFVIETRKFNINLPLARKQLLNGAMWLMDISGNFTLNVEWRPDYYPCYFQWFNRSYDFQTKICSTADCMIANSQNGSVVRQLFQKPPELCLQGIPIRAEQGRLFQFRISGTGAGTLAAFQAIFRDLPERATGDCTI